MMNNDHLSRLGELESEFTQELTGEGSLSPHLVRDPANFTEEESGDAQHYLGYDIHPEDLEALYFEALGLPRWESIRAENVAQQELVYRESLQNVVSAYPLLGRVSDTDQKVPFNRDEVLQLREECERVLQTASEPKAIRALQKFYIACAKAVEHETGLILLPSHSMEDRAVRR